VLVQAIASDLNRQPQSSLSEEVRNRLAELNRVLNQLRGLVALQDSSVAEQLVSTTRAQAFQFENQRGQIERLQQTVENSGHGRVWPSCWTRPDGTIDYLLEVGLTTGGLSVREATVPARQKKRVELDLDPFDASRVLAPSAFLEKTAKVFAVSQRQQCRFYVRVYDETGDDEKVTYKRLLKAVEGHFYKQDRPGTMPLN
jgi:hypothetical protein